MNFNRKYPNDCNSLRLPCTYDYTWLFVAINFNSKFIRYIVGVRFVTDSMFVSSSMQSRASDHRAVGFCFVCLDEVYIQAFLPHEFAIESYLSGHMLELEVW